MRFLFNVPENYFGLFWGSIKPYNLIVFLNNNAPIAGFSGADIGQIIGLVPDGGTSAYINFYTNSTFYDEVVLITLAGSFDVANVAFGDPPVGVPEPSSLPLVVFAFIAIAFGKRATSNSTAAATRGESRCA